MQNKSMVFYTQTQMCANVEYFSLYSIFHSIFHKKNRIQKNRKTVSSERQTWADFQIFFLIMNCQLDAKNFYVFCNMLYHRGKQDTVF